MPARQRYDHSPDARGLKGGDVKAVSESLEHKSAPRLIIGGPFRRLLRRAMLLAFLSAGTFVVYWMMRGSEAARINWQQKEPTLQATWYDVRNLL
jgi:hypothetical protein